MGAFVQIVTYICLTRPGTFLLLLSVPFPQFAQQNFVQCANSKRSPLVRPGINAFLFAICAYSKVLLWWLPLWQFSHLTVFETVHCASPSPHTILMQYQEDELLRKIAAAFHRSVSYVHHLNQQLVTFQ